MKFCKPDEATEAVVVDVVVEEEEVIDVVVELDVDSVVDVDVVSRSTAFVE